MAVADDGTVWYTAQGSGELGRLDPATGEVVEIPLGDGSRPHGVTIGPDRAPWITDSGLNAIVRVDPVSLEVRAFPLPDDRGGANLNTAAFDEPSLPLPSDPGEVRQIHGRPGEVWGAESAADKLVVIHT